MIIVGQDDRGVRADKIGAEPISIDTDAWRRDMLLHDIEDACREFIAARDGRSGTNAQTALVDLTQIVGVLFR